MALPPPQRDFYYRDFFGDTSNDPFAGEYANVLQPYHVPDDANHVQPAQLRAVACNARNQGAPTAFILFHEDDQRIHCYVHLDRFDARMGRDPTPWDDRMFIIKGDMVHNNQTIVEFQDDYFNVTNRTRVPSANAINNAYAQNADTIYLGPYVEADADTEAIRGRRTCYVPPPYVPLFLAQPLTPREAWLTVYTQIVNDNRVDACAPLVNFLKLAITRSNNNDLPLIGALPAPNAPLADATLLDRFHTIKTTCFPQLNANVAIAEAEVLAGHLNNIHTALEVRNNADAAARVAANQPKTPTASLGATGILKLQRYCHVQTEAELPQFWRDIAAAPKNSHIGILQAAIEEQKLDNNEQFLEFEATASLLTTVKSFRWQMISNDAVDTGLNIFQMKSSTNDFKGMSHQEAYELLTSGGANPTLMDASALLKAEPEAPVTLVLYRDQVRRYEILMRILLPVAHPLPNRLEGYAQQLNSLMGRLTTLQATKYPILPTLLCKRLCLDLSYWYSDQATNPGILAPPNVSNVFMQIMREDSSWLPDITPAFLDRIGLNTLPSVNPPRIDSLPPSAGTDASSGAGNGSGAGNAGTGRVNNVHFNEGLFDNYRKVKVASRDIRGKIRKGELPEVPMSKVDGQRMCISWHIKGMCNEGCSRISDHVTYTNEEYLPLSTWCKDHYPTA